MGLKLTNFLFMNKQVILNTIAFLKRVNLSGEEVPYYNECINYLNGEFSKQEEEKKEEQ
jgi:hypothetical protein